MNFEWEEIYSDSFSDTERASVKGGWIVKHTEIFEGRNGESISMVFVPDTNHKWKIENADNS